MGLAGGHNEFSSCRGFLVLQGFLIGFLAFSGGGARWVPHGIMVPQLALTLHLLHRER